MVVAFDIEKGREVYVERVEIYGHTKTKDHVIRRELRQNEGERYSASNVRRSKERLGRLSYVEKPRISTPKGDAPDKIKNTLFTNQVTTVFFISPCTSISCISFSRSTGFSRLNESSDIDT